MSNIINKSNDAVSQTMSATVSEIKGILEQSRIAVAKQVNQALIATYWKIGETIIKYEQNDQVRATYGEKTLLQLSKELTKELGKGFSRSNIYNMRQLYLCYPNFQTLSGKLSWSHYCELLGISELTKGLSMRKNVLIPLGQYEN